MEGFYTKQEAARLLGVSERQINNYINEEKLSKAYSGKKLWIPRTDVQRLYDRRKRGPLLGQKELLDLIDKVEDLEGQVEVLKLGLGFGSKRDARGEGELLTLRQGFADGLTKGMWSRKRMSKVADELMKVLPEEVAHLSRICGPVAWLPMCDLAGRMLTYISSHPDYPDRGFDVLETRLIRSRDRFFGLVYASTKVDLGIERKQAEKVYQTIEVPPNSLEKHIVEYLVR